MGGFTLRSTTGNTYDCYRCKKEFTADDNELIECLRNDDTEVYYCSQECFDKHHEGVVHSCKCNDF